MARSIAAGLTDYSHQSLEDMILDLEEWKSFITKDLETVTSLRTHLQENGYWEENVIFNLKSDINKSIKFLDTSLQEITTILIEIRSEIESHHISRLNRLAETAHELSGNIGWTWNNDFLSKSYGEENFVLLERMYATVRGIEFDMLDLSNLTERLKDFVGKKPPTFVPPDPKLIKGGLWVLEGDDQQTQGTAFELSSVGLVTCQHVVVENKIFAFRHDDPTKKYEVKVKAQNATIDLAILQIDAPLNNQLEIGIVDNVKQLDQVIVAGFPNFRHGDSITITIGAVSGFRTISTIRRMQIDAPIVAGMSGGPVFNSDHQVIGVAVTGADRMEESNHVEHGVIPIDALKYLE